MCCLRVRFELFNARKNHNMFVRLSQPVVVMPNLLPLPEFGFAQAAAEQFLGPQRLQFFLLLQAWLQELDLA